MYSEEQQNVRDQIVNEYGPDLDKITRYLPYFEKKTKDSQNFYDGDGTFKTIPVPVYDSNLLAFVKEAGQTKFMNRNYPYTYRRYRLKTPQDERRAMERAKITDIELFRGILSKYVLEGQRKGMVWTTGLNEQIYISMIKNLNRLFYDHSNESEKYLLNK